MSITGYKVFNPDWTCRGKAYTCPGIFEEDVEPVACKSGMHFCKKAIDCFNYYIFDPRNHIAEVIAHGTVVEYNDKCCTNKLEIVREIPWTELLELVNVGESNSGIGNNGNRNSGDYNNGDYNSGYRNSGGYNSGDYNSGYRNSGSHNNGDYNNGDWNSGYYNSGHCNSGNYNTGYWNSGKRNSGCYNSGDYNSGDWNSSDYNSGCFNTATIKIHLFNKPSDWTYEHWFFSKARLIMNTIPNNFIWVEFARMTDEEKKTHPTAEITNGYLRKIPDDELAVIRNEWWARLSPDKKDEILKLPNFDARIFKEITMIDVTNAAE